MSDLGIYDTLKADWRIMLFTKCILREPELEDGIRISIMSRHTLSDGKTPDIRITRELYDIHRPELGPNAVLIGDLKKREIINWDRFEELYIADFRSSEKCKLVQELACVALRVDITLLCIEETAEFCHRRLLAGECRRYEPSLIIQHR